MASEISYSRVEVVYNVIGEVIGWGSREIVNDDVPLSTIKMSPVLKKMYVRITGNEACRGYYPNLNLDIERQACGLGRNDNATTRVFYFIVFNNFEILVRINYFNLY